MLKITLPYEVDQKAIEFGKKQAEKKFDFWSYKQTREQACILGARAEAAFCEAISIPYDPIFYEDKGDEGHDFNIEGLKIEIKAVNEPNYNLVLSQTKIDDVKADIMVLIKPDFNGPWNRMSIIGYMTLRDLPQYHYLQYFKNKDIPKVAVKHGDLFKVYSKEALVKAIKDYKESLCLPQ